MNRDPLIMLCKSLADMQVQLHSAFPDKHALEDIAELAIKLQWPCSELLRDLWTRLRNQVVLAPHMEKEQQSLLARQLSTAVSQSYTALETTRLCLLSHPELAFAQLQPIVAGELLRLCLPDSESQTSTEDSPDLARAPQQSQARHQPDTQSDRSPSS